VRRRAPVAVCPGQPAPGARPDRVVGVLANVVVVVNVVVASLKADGEL
jgi:hypothetical protein